METQAVGRILVTAKVESLPDLYKVQEGTLPAEQVRFVEIPEALVDTSATILSMPKRLIDQLGLLPVRTRRARSSAGSVTLQIYSGVRLTIQGRDCLSDVAEVPEDCPVLIGQVPLELLDFVADCKNHRLIGNPEHGGEHMLDMY